MTNYELMVIYEKSLKDDGAKKEVSALKDLLTKLGATVKKTDYWGLKDLSYPIKKETQAYYYVTNFEINPDQIENLMAHLSRRDSGVVRNLLTKV